MTSVYSPNLKLLLHPCVICKQTKTKILQIFFQFNLIMNLLEKESLECNIDAFYNAINLFLTSPSIVSKRICRCEVLKWGAIREFNEEKIVKIIETCTLDDSSNIWENFEQIFDDFSIKDRHEETLLVVTEIFPKKVDRNQNFLTISFIG